MLIHSPTSSPNLSPKIKIPTPQPLSLNAKSNNHYIDNIKINNATTTIMSIAQCSLSGCVKTSVAAAAAAALVVAASAWAVEPPPEAETLSNIPQTLSGECALPTDCKKARIQRPKSRKAESCTSKCVTTCIQGGDGSPGEGPFNIRRPIVVFKQGFRSRKYCLVECSEICNLLKDGDDIGP